MIFWKDSVRRLTCTICFAWSMLFLLANTPVIGQSTLGITNIPDTSYTNYSALQHIKKDHPEAVMVPEFSNKNIKQKKGIVYCKLGKRKLLLDAFVPTGNEKSRTAIIIIHGGGWRSGSRMQHYPLAQALANKGYVCFTPEYRLSTEALFPAGVYDIKATIRWVKANADAYGIDPEKIVISGFSAGGEMAAFMGTTGNMPLFEGTQCNTSFTSNVGAVVDIDGTLSFVHPDGGEDNDSLRTSAGTYWFGYRRKDNPILWQAASPLSYTSKATPPTLFINSSVPRMHAGRQDYINILNNHGIYSEVKEFEKAPHSFPQFHPWFNPMVETIDAFLKKVFVK